MMPYPEWNTVPIKCGSRKCGWTGMEGDLLNIPDPKHSQGTLKVTTNVCPKCGGDKYSFIKRKPR